MSDSRSKTMLERRPWNVSRARTIDDDTLSDMLGMIHYEADRASVLDQVGFNDFGSSTTVLLDFVLDAIGVPQDGDEKHLEGENARFSRTCRFSRTKFYELVFGDFAVENEGNENPPTRELLNLLKNEVANNLRSYYV